MKFSMDGPNARIELPHQETHDLLKALPADGAAITAALVGFGVPAVAVGIVSAALTAHMAWEGVAIKAADKGQGVFLTSPMVPFGPIGLFVIPSTRYEVDNENWSARDDDVIGSSEGDVIETHIDHGGDPKTVVFRLNNQSPEGWDKALMLRDGLGGQFWIQAKGSVRPKTACGRTRSATDSRSTSGSRSSAGPGPTSSPFAAWSAAARLNRHVHVEKRLDRALTHPA